MKTTENYKLKKPDADDFYNIDDQNENMDIIDAKLATMSSGIAQNVEELSQVKTKLETKPSYEEGVFSPKIMNGSVVPSLIKAEYKKVDRIVYIAIKFYFNTEIDTTQIGGILGLPFVVSEENATGGFYPLSVKTDNGNCSGIVAFDNYMDVSPAVAGISDLLGHQSANIIRLYGQYETTA